ncbi:metalloenzyme [Gracilariopsis chorda]|nr:metalloenzyme [Gracilariopsis chorda]
MKLPPKPGFTKPDGPVALIIMDGVGQAPDAEWNAVTTSRTPFLDKLMAGEGPNGSKSLFCELDASGKSVGLPSMGDMGNSEVGHNALGAGRVFDQGAKLVNNAFRSGQFKSDVWQWLVENCRGDDANTFHMIGLYSDGNVHAHVNHVFQLIDGAIDDGVKRIRIHPLADGRDVLDRSALDYFGPLEKRLATLRKEGIDICVASSGGRMITTMDRYEADWGMVENGWRAHCLGDTSLATFKSCIDAVEHFYKDDDMVDQYMPPFVIVDDDGNAVGPMSDGDSVLFWNFRGDRAIEISTAFEAEEGEFHGFDRKRVPDVRYAGMMQYDGDAGIPKRFLVSPPQIERTVGEYVVKNGMKRFSVSETQKYGHVTYFYNGNRAAKFDEHMEKYHCIPSYRQREHTRPWMKAAEISDSILDEMDNFKPDLMVVNYANGDMVGHTGHMVASRLAMECVDLCLARVVPQIIKRGGVVILTADHGNCDIMAEVGKDGKPRAGNQPEGWKAKVSHTKQRVPCMIIGNEMDKYEIDTSVKWGEDKESKCPGIANLGATVLNLLGLQEPADYLPSVLVPRG